MDNSNAVNKSQIVTLWFSKIHSFTHAVFTSVLDVLGQLVHHHYGCSFNYFELSVPFSDMLHTHYTIVLQLFTGPCF
jgi:hypothetical protein